MTDMILVGGNFRWAGVLIINICPGEIERLARWDELPTPAVPTKMKSWRCLVFEKGGDLGDFLHGFLHVTFPHETPARQHH